MEHWKEIKTHAGCYSHQINVTNTMKGTFRWLEKYLLTEHNFISMSFNDSTMTGHKKLFSLPPFPSYVLWMLISVSFSDSPSLAFISGRPSNWLTCVSKGEQHHIRPEASTRKKRWLKRLEGREIHLQAICRISPHFLYFSMSPNSHSPAHTSLNIFLSTRSTETLFFLISAPPLTQPPQTSFLYFPFFAQIKAQMVFLGAF